MKDIFIVDRTEGEYIVLEQSNGEMISVKKEIVKGSIEEGDCLIKNNNYFIIDNEETKKRKEKIVERVKGMWEE